MFPPGDPKQSSKREGMLEHIGAALNRINIILLRNGRESGVKIVIFLVKQPDFSPSRLHFSDCWHSSSIAMVNICFRTLRAAMASSLVNTFKNVGRLQKVWQVSDLSGWRQRGGVF